MKHTLKAFSLAATLAAFSSAAFASSIPVPVVTTASYTGTFITTVPGSGTAPSGPGVTTPFSVSFTESVYRGGTGALCPTCIDFVYNFSNTAAAGFNPIEDMTTSNFSGFLFTTGYVAGTGVAPFDYSVNGVGTITFDFTAPTNQVDPGKAADTFVVFTNAMNYAPGTLSFQDGTTLNEPGLGFQPAAPTVTPEPSSLVLLGTGILGVAGVARRKFFTK